MTDADNSNPLKLLELEHARLVAEASAKEAEAKAAAQRAAAVARDMAELARITATYNLNVSAPEAPVIAAAAAESGSLTLAALVEAYRSDKNSPYHKVQFKTRENYESQLRRLSRQHGHEKIADLDDDRVQELRAMWSADGHLAMMDALTGMLRMVASYGASALKSKECRTLKGITAEMNIRTYKPRLERLTTDQVSKIIKAAHEMDRASIALAQAIQFECGLKQGTVIGTWVPISEHGPATHITRKGRKWLPGLRWSSVDYQQSTFRHPSGEVRLDDIPMVKAELAHRGLSNPAPSDPLIVYERKGLPYESYQFRREWRLVANAAAIPKEMRNMDSRPERDEERATEGKSSVTRS